MTAPLLQRRGARDRMGFKGPHAAQWLTAQGIGLPPAPNTWLGSAAVVGATGAAGADDVLLTARLGTSEFFIEDCAGGTSLRGIDCCGEAYPAGVYPVLREDAAFSLSGPGSIDVLAQVCNVNFADLDCDSRPVIMTMMVGVAVLVVAQEVNAERRFRIWCDPTFGTYLEASLGRVVIESGGKQGESE